MDLEFASKRALVTGSCGGIGGSSRKPVHPPTH